MTDEPILMSCAEFVAGRKPAIREGTVLVGGRRRRDDCFGCEVGAIALKNSIHLGKTDI